MQYSRHSRLQALLILTPSHHLPPPVILPPLPSRMQQAAQTLAKASAKRNQLPPPLPAASVLVLNPSQFKHNWMAVLQCRTLQQHSRTSHVPLTTVLLILLRLTSAVQLPCCVNTKNCPSRMLSHSWNTFLSRITSTKPLFSKACPLVPEKSGYNRG